MFKRIVLAALIMILLAGGFFAYKFFSPAVHNTDGNYFYVNTGDDVATVKKNLIAGKFISGKRFDLTSRLLKYKNARPGRYKPAEGMSLVNLIKMLRSADQSTVKMVIIKERTKELFAGKVGKGKRYDFECDSLQMINFLNSNDSLKEFGVDTSTVMALVMPYTYELKWNSSPGNIFDQFAVAYKRFWTAARKEKADSLRLTPIDVITMASIIEEETNKKEDRYKIASVYLNRIQLGMPLQADPTVKYATKNFGLKRITGIHLRIVSPYNTYLNKGLPPGPICTPSVASIDAVLNAPNSNYIYFVASSRFDGSSEFTSNYTDHLKVARAYQQELTRRMDSSKKANASK